MAHLTLFPLQTSLLPLGKRGNKIDSPPQKPQADPLPPNQEATMPNQKRRAQSSANPASPEPTPLPIYVSPGTSTSVNNNNNNSATECDVCEVTGPERSGHVVVPPLAAALAAAAGSDGRVPGDGDTQRFDNSSDEDEEDLLPEDAGSDGEGHSLPPAARKKKPKASPPVLRVGGKAAHPEWGQVKLVFLGPLAASVELRVDGELVSRSCFRVDLTALPEDEPLFVAPAPAASAPAQVPPTILKLPTSTPLPLTALLSLCAGGGRSSKAQQVLSRAQPQDQAAVGRCVRGRWRAQDEEPLQGDSRVAHPRVPDGDALQVGRRALLQVVQESPACTLSCVAPHTLLRHTAHSPAHRTLSCTLSCTH